jgi:hypothetical protein
MSQGTAASYRLGPWTGMLLALLVAAPSAAEEASFDLAAAVTGDARRRPYTLVAPLAAREPLVDREAAAGGREDAEAARSGPDEEAPIPFEVGAPAEPAPWPYALPFLADDVLKRGYTLPLPRGVSLVYTYVERDIKIQTVKLGITCTSSPPVCRHADHAPRVMIVRPNVRARAPDHARD